MRKLGPFKPGLRQFGVPKGGPFDTWSAQMACALVCAKPSGTAFELEMATATLHLEQNVLVSLVGGGHIAEDGGRPLAPNSCWLIRAGQKLRISYQGQGARAYCALTSLAPDAVLQIDQLVSKLSDPPWTFERKVFRYSPLGQPTLVRGVVGAESNRVGVRVSAEIVAHDVQIGLSQPIVEGTMQVPPKGGLIVTGPDGPTIGGYERIGVVIAADFPALGQLVPGESVEFVPVGQDVAFQAYKEANDRDSRQCEMVRSLVSDKLQSLGVRLGNIAEDRT
ncbi:MAG: hypothetical protein JNM34_11590 [Chthonomonadaceae bacterium]|nr:hypothetical protein [Chthonomonadaceae bacterium]